MARKKTPNMRINAKRDANPISSVKKELINKKMELII